MQSMMKWASAATPVGWGLLLVLLTLTLLLSACSSSVSAVATPSVAATTPTPAATAPASTPSPSPSPVVPTPSPLPATATPTAAPNPAATAAGRATATANTRAAQAVAHLGAGNTLLRSGNLAGAVHEYATARALAPARPDVASAAATAQALVKATAQAQPTPVPVVPMRLQIPAIGVSAPIELLGLTSTGAMEAPEGWWDAGWYRYGPLPGQTGNSVIAGHLDSTTGPALFWRLGALGSGDKVDVTLSNGQTEDFVVQRQVSYSDSNAPLKEIFGPATTADLNLITCGGIWNPFQHNYSNRTVIYARKAG